MYKNTNYKPLTYEEIFHNMLITLQEKGLLNCSIEEIEEYINQKHDLSNYLVLDKSINAQEINNCYNELTNVYESTNINKAKGEDLDKLGAIVGLNRNPATYSVVPVIFTVKEKHSIIQLEPGIRLITNKGIEYVTINQLIMGEDENSVIVPAKSTVPGPEGRINAGGIERINSALPYIFHVTNSEDSSGGFPAQSDEDYRLYLKEWQRTNQQGNINNYSKYLKSYDGIESFNMIPLWDGSGTLKIVVDGDIKYDSLKEDLNNYVSVLPVDITIIKPEPKDISVSMNVSANVKGEVAINELKLLIEKLTSIFIMGGEYKNTRIQGLSIGSAYIPHKLSVFLDKQIPELENITFINPELISVADDEKIELKECKVNIV